MKKKAFAEYITNFNFKDLFINLGWDNFNNKLAVAINDDAFQLSGIVEKKGFVILHCSPLANGKIPLSNIRKQIEKKVTQNYFEHLIIYSDEVQTQQIWQFVIKEENKPKQVREITWYNHQDVEILFQRLKNLLFTIDEEEKITLIDVKARVSENIATNTETVTKKFYTEFKKQHTVFLDFIEGMDDHISNKENKNKQWYASLMLNRLMFCYFIQKKGFLNQDINYMQNKLQESKKLEGKSNFYNFYRSFLLELFHDGLGKPENHRHKHPIELGKIPYLNGGLFDVHELEKQFSEIEIDDDAFENIFNFFDQWNWHLDTNIKATGRDINPDVIGYIFEKYINDRSAMGAYYTKEDITEYIGKNTIIPFLFDETERHYKKAFKQDSELWDFLKNSSDTYIYDAVKKGILQDKDIFDDLPDKIKQGFKPELEKKIVVADKKPHLWEIRKEWNRKAPQEIALPTETYRELIERRKRYAEIKSKIETGEITQINDFITYNLNIRQFTQDFIENTNDAEFIKHFYKAIKKITILDPTTGSGAFLFAAMNILEPLYEACIMRMEQFVNEEQKKHKFFEEVLKEVNLEQHTNLKYYIFKNIILNNLYGVDIMKEAVEIAKLRLFLKLVATVDVNARKPNYGLEPLPDIDFNIRAGNTLVGFATEKELLETIQKVDGLFADDKLQEFKEEFELVSKAYKHFQDAQLINNQGSDNFKKAKAELNKRLKQLNHKLNIYLASNYGITEPENRQKQQYKNWLETHQPFHWFAEFYDIINGNGGFDVIIGNPPYVIYKKETVKYKIFNYTTISSNNLYAFCIERSNLLANNIGMIVPINLVSGAKLKKTREIINNQSTVFYSNYDIRPSKLFDGIDQRLTIFIKNNIGISNIYTTKYNRWENINRMFLFKSINYNKYSEQFFYDLIPKLGKNIEIRIYKKLNNNLIHLYEDINSIENSFYYRSAGGRYFLLFFDKKQSTIINDIKTTIKAEKEYKLPNEFNNKLMVSTLYSSLFYINFINFSDTRNLTKEIINSFNLPKTINNSVKLRILSKKIINNLHNTSKKKLIIKSSGDKIILWEHYPKLSKPIIDEIDTVLAEHYGFTEEELDFIINYDIKYRMGKELDAYIDGTLGKQEVEE